MDRDDLETLRTEVPGAGDEHDRRPSARDLETFRKVEERFELGDEIGRGGMGRVLDARDVALRRQVAIKQVLSTTEHDLIRFEREVRITAELEHSPWDVTFGRWIASVTNATLDDVTDELTRRH